MTEHLLETGSNAAPEMAGSSGRNAHEGGALISLEPSEPTRRAMARLRRAVAARASIRHPNVLPARFLGEGDGRLFVAVAPPEHRSLSDLLAAGPLAPTECVLLLDGAAAGADALRQRGLVALDLTPDRMLVHPARGAVLMDLGILPELLRQAPPGGDPDVSIRSREDLAGKPAHARTSVYSLGALLFTALTGAPPDLPRATPPPPRERRSELPPDIYEVAARAMAADPADRYPDARALSRAVAAAAGVPPETLPSEHARDEGRSRTPELPRQRSPERAAERAPSREAKSKPRPPKKPLTAPTAAQRVASSMGRGAGPRVRRTLRRPGRLVLPAVAAIAASALSGIALGHAVQTAGREPSSITRSGLTVQLPPGWEPAEVDAGRPAFSSAFAAAPSGLTMAGFVVGRLGSEAAAERMLERAGSGGQPREQVRLGVAYAWRYAGLRPRPHLVGVGYLLPAGGGAVVMLCHASPAEAAARLAECGRAATTLVVAGASTHPLRVVDPSAPRLSRAVAALRSQRSDGLQRLAAAHLAAGQARVATSLERSYERAASSLSDLQARRLSAALRAAAEAYGRLAQAAATRRPPAYRDARRAVARAETAVRRELARANAD